VNRLTQHGNRPPQLDVDTSYRYAVLHTNGTIYVRYWDGEANALTWACEPGNDKDLQYVLASISDEASSGLISFVAASELQQMLRAVFEC